MTTNLLPLTCWHTETKSQLVRNLLQLMELVNRRLISHYFSEDVYNVAPTEAIIGVFRFVDESFSIPHNRNLTQDTFFLANFLKFGNICRCREWVCIPTSCPFFAFSLSNITHSIIPYFYHSLPYLPRSSLFTGWLMICSLVFLSMPCRKLSRAPPEWPCSSVWAEDPPFIHLLASWPLAAVRTDSIP